MSDLRNSGDEWVIAADGGRYWGRFGAAGLLAHDPKRGILLQHRVSWSDHGNTWGIPGGARHEGESAVDAALRESHEEAAVPYDAVLPRYRYVIDRGGWSYTTIIADVIRQFTPEITDPESHAIEWVDLDRVKNYSLHPGFAASWSQLHTIFDEDPTALEQIIAEGSLTLLEG